MTPSASSAWTVAAWITSAGAWTWLAWLLSAKSRADRPIQNVANTRNRISTIKKAMPSIPRLPRESVVQLDERAEQPGGHAQHHDHGGESQEAGVSVAFACKSMGVELEARLPRSCEQPRGGFGESFTRS